MEKMTEKEAALVRMIRNSTVGGIVGDSADYRLGAIPVDANIARGCIEKQYLVRQESSRVLYVTTKRGREAAGRFPEPAKYVPQRVIDNRFGRVQEA